MKRIPYPPVVDENFNRFSEPFAHQTKDALSQGLRAPLTCRPEQIPGIISLETVFFFVGEFPHSIGTMEWDGMGV